MKLIRPQLRFSCDGATLLTASAHVMSFACVLLLLCSGAAPLRSQTIVAQAQDPSSGAPESSPPVTPPVAPPIAPGVNTDLAPRIARARALAVVGQGVSAARELEAIRTALASDASHPARGVACVLLMGLYVEQADYRRAQNLLRDTAAQRQAAINPASRDEAARTYYAVAGQLLNGLRARLDRYRYYNVPVAGTDAPPEVTSDIEGLRTLLDQLVQQAREANPGITPDANGAGTGAARTDAAALFEDATGMRLMLARTPQERQTWQRELADARQRLAAVEPRMQPATVARAQPVVNQPAPNSATNANANTPPPRETVAPVRNTEPNNLPSSADTTSPNTTPANRTSNEATGRVAAAPSPTNVSTNTSTNAVTSGSPFDVGSLVDRATQRVAPSYPSSARSARVGGVVTVYVVVGERGNVEDVSRAAGPQLLRRAAEDAVRRWRFRPTIVDGQPTRVTGFVSFNFAL